MNDDWRNDFNAISHSKDGLKSDSELTAVFQPFHDADARLEIEAMANRIGVTPPRVIQISPEGRELAGMGHAEVLLSKEGTAYILLDSTLTKEQAVAIASHELGHILHDDMRLDHMPTNAESVTMESRADRTTAQLCQGRQAAAYIQENLHYDSPTHPAIDKRVADLIKGAEFSEKYGACSGVTLSEQQEAGAPTTGHRSASPSVDRVK